MTPDLESVRVGMQSAIPFNGHVGLLVDEITPGRGVVTLPDRAELRNHVGSQHAGALFAAGEAASGAAFVSAFAERLANLTPLAERAEISYTRIARGEIKATGTLAREADALVAEIEQEGRVRFPIDVVLTDAQGRTVAEMTVHWYVRVKDD